MASATCLAFVSLSSSCISVNANSIVVPAPWLVMRFPSITTLDLDVVIVMSLLTDGWHVTERSVSTPAACSTKGAAHIAATVRSEARNIRIVSASPA